jgi:hypothetical protein
MTTTYHAAHFTEHPQRDTVWRAISAHLAGLVPRQAAVLEVGAGYCHGIDNVAAGRRVALDIWPGVASHATPRFLPCSMRDRRMPMAAWLGRACLASPCRPRGGQMLVVAARR